MWSNLPWSSHLCHPFSISVVWSKVMGNVFSVLFRMSLFYVQVIKKSWGWREIVHKYLCPKPSTQQVRCLTGVCAAVMSSVAECESTQVHCHVVCIHWFITEFENFYAEILSFLWNVLPEDNPALEFYSYLVHCQMLWGVIEFTISPIECVRGLCELSAKCRKQNV